MIRDLICKRCGIKVGEEETVRTTAPKKVKLCSNCKKESLLKHKQVLCDRNKSELLRNKNSKRMSISNPMKNSEIKNKVQTTLKEKFKNGYKNHFHNPDKLKEIKSKWKITDEGRKRLSQRMRDNNPMKCLTSKNKMINTFMEKICSGEIKYKKGIEHHLWKGNRGFQDSLRVQLYPVWTFKCLERDNFTCQECSTTTQLTVHHIKPLRQFIEDICIKYSLKISDIPVSEWQKYFDEIIANHKLDDGITLCKSCHSNIDKYYNF